MASKAEQGVWYRLTKSTHITQKQCSGEMWDLSPRVTVSSHDLQLWSFVQEMKGSRGFLSAYVAISQHPGPPLCHFFPPLPSLLL